MINLSGSELKTANAWFHDILVWGGLAQQPKRVMDPYEYRYMYGYYSYGGGSAKKAAETICKAFELRPASYKFLTEADAALETLSNYQFIPRLDAKRNSGAVYRSAEELADYVAYFCRKGNLFWDTTTISTYELEEIKNTKLGKALWDAKLFTNQEDDPVPQVQPKQRATNSGIPGQPKNDYKSQGAKSDQMIGLVGQPHDKTYLAGGKVLAISGFDANGKALDVNATAFVRPLKSKYATADGTANRILFGASKGYDDCRIYLPEDKLAEMTQLAADLVSTPDFKPAANVANIRVVYKNADNNGYFKVNTNLGEVYVSARKMNENLEEAAEEKPAIQKSDLLNYKDPKYKLVVPNSVFTENFLND